MSDVSIFIKICMDKPDWLKMVTDNDAVIKDGNVYDLAIYGLTKLSSRMPIRFVEDIF